MKRVGCLRCFAVSKYTAQKTREGWCTETEIHRRAWSDPHSSQCLQLESVSRQIYSGLRVGDEMRLQSFSHQDGKVLKHLPDWCWWCRGGCLLGRGEDSNGCLCSVWFEFKSTLSVLQKRAWQWNSNEKHFLRPSVWSVYIATIRYDIVIFQKIKGQIKGSRCLLNNYWILKVL